MKSPFPGMDPYLEARWSDVHTKLCAFLGEALQPSLPRDLRARSEERVLLETVELEPIAAYRTDVAVAKGPKRDAGPDAAPGSVAATLEPVVVELRPRTLIDRTVHIIDVTHGNRLVTAIEILSPWNKRPGRLNRRYRRKLVDYARARVSVVEIDLLRGSRSSLPVGQQNLPPQRQAPYLYCVRRAWRPSRWELYPVSMRERLPSLPVPLRKTDRQVTVDLQPLMDRIYTAGGHDDIDYRQPPGAPLAGEDKDWAEALLKACGRG